MRSLNENQFHAVMGVLLVGSLFLDQGARAILPTWNPPEVGLMTLVLGLVWVGLFAAHRVRKCGDRVLVAEDRLERLQRRLDAMEDEERQRRPRP